VPSGSLATVLVLSRRLGESVVIGDDVVVTVLEVRGDVVRIGIDAPRSVSVQRAELLEQVSDANAEAASPSPADVASLTDELNKHQ
jgi:carbon storage regulator